MAKKSVIVREEKREKLEAKYREFYQETKRELQACYAELQNGSDSDELYDRIEMLQKRLDVNIPRNATRKRHRNRCQLTGRPRGVYSRFKLGRNMLRKLAMNGLVPGVRKASW